MSRYLLDTTVLLKWLAAPHRLAKPVRGLIADRGNEVLVSAASAWEIALQKMAGFQAPANLVEVLRAEHMELLPITAEHALRVADLPLHHEDVIDRILIAQARLESLHLVTFDERLAKYDVDVIRAN